MKVVGLVGPLASGKGVVAKYFIERGFLGLRVSDPIKYEVVSRRLEVTRQTMQDVGNEFRELYGSDYWAKKLSERIDTRDVVVDGLRNPGEVVLFKEQYNAYILGVNASSEKRFELVKFRQKKGDPKTWEEFIRLESRDRGVGENEFGQQVSRCLDMADMVLENEGSEEDLLRKTEDIYIHVINTQGVSNGNKIGDKIIGSRFLRTDNP